MDFDFPKVYGDTSIFDGLILWPDSELQHKSLIFLQFLPYDKEEQGWNIDGEKASYQRPSKGHLENQLGSVWLRTEKELVHRILSQLLTVALITKTHGVKFDSLLEVLWYIKAHPTSLAVKRIPF